MISLLAQTGLLKQFEGGPFGYVLEKPESYFSSTKLIQFKDGTEIAIKESGINEFHVTYKRMIAYGTELGYPLQLLISDKLKTYLLREWLLSLRNRESKQITEHL